MESAILISALLLIALGTLGFFLKKLIWNGSVAPSNNIEYGRKFSSYVIFISLISSTHFFTSSDLTNAVVKLLITTTIFTFLAFIIGYAFSILKSNFKNLAQHKSSSIITRKKYIALGSIVVVILLISYFQFYTTHSNKSKWVKISQLNSTIGKNTYYFDEASKSSDGNLTYAFTGIQNESDKGNSFIKFKLQGDCKIPKYRIIESFKYEGVISDGLNNLIEKDIDKDVQTTRTNIMLTVMPSYVYDGGWDSVDSINESINLFKKENLTISSEMIKKNQIKLAELKLLCD